MLKALSLILVFGFSTVYAQTTVRTKPPLNQSDMTGGQSEISVLKRNISTFVESSSDEIKRCSNGAAVKQNDFLGIYNYISLKVDELEKKPACENEFLKCLVTDDFSTKISNIVESKNFIGLMQVDKTISRKEAKQMRKFYRRLISEVKPQ